MASLALQLCAFATLAALASAIPITKVPMNGTVMVTSLMMGGEKAPLTTPCTAVDGSGCPELQAAEDSVTVSYSFPASAVKPGSYVSLTACYSTDSSYDRAWRKPNPMDFTKSKDCPYKFATKLPVPSGTGTWHVPEKIPESTVFIRAWLWNQQADGTFKQVNYGRSKTYLKIKKINDVPKTIKGAVAACCLFSPIMVAAFLCYEKYGKKTH